MSQRFTFVLDDMLKRKLEQKAEKLSLNQSEVVRHAVAENLKNTGVRE